MNPLLRYRDLFSPAAECWDGVVIYQFHFWHVKDSEGAVIDRATITIHWDSGVVGKENADTVVTSDKNGQFTVEVAPGSYDIFVSAPAFSPQCTKVRVRDAEPAIYMPRLRADPLVIKERGDTF